MKTKRAYLCDGTACERQCAKTMTPEEWKEYPCHHTMDENHAKNKIRRKRKFVLDKGEFIEVEK